MRQIVLLRGINLGSRNRVAMGELRELLTGAGLHDVVTYLQSGNVVLSSELAPERLARECERRIARGLGLEIDVLARTAEEIARVVARNPLAKVAVDPKLYQVSFLSAELDAAKLEELRALAAPSERLLADGRELYAWHPDGVARSRLWARLAARDLGVKATARNWRTVRRLSEMAQGARSPASTAYTAAPARSRSAT